MFSYLALSPTWAHAEALGPAGGVTTLDEVVVTASRIEEKAKEVAANVTVIDKKEIEASGSRTLGEILAEKAVGHIQEYPGALTAIGIRGFRTETHGNDLMGHVLILINGRRAATGNAAKIMIRNNVERIEIIRGPASVQYGSAAMGGVVNIITKRGADNSAFVEGGLGSWGYDEEGLGLSANAKGIDFYGAVEHRSMDDYDTASGDRYKNTGFSRQENVYVNLGYEFLPGNRIGVIYNDYNGDGIGTPDYLERNDLDDYKDAGNESIDLMYEGMTQGGTFSWMARYFDGEDENAWFDRMSSNPSGWDDGIPTRNETDQKGAQARVAFDTDHVGLVAGFDWDNYEIDATYNPKKSEYDNTAGYLLGRLRFLDERLILTGGFRSDWYDVEMKEPRGRDEDDHEITPRLGVAFLLTDYLKLRANYGEGFRMPAADELAYDSTFWGVRYLGNPDLDPEKSETWEAGFDLARRSFNASMTLFWTDFKDKIQTVSKPGPIKTWENIGGADIDGLEGEFSYDIGGFFPWGYEIRPYVNFTYLFKYEDDQSGKDLLYTERANVSYGLQVSNRKDFTAALNLTYTGEKDVNDWQNAGPPTWVAPVVEEGGFTVATLTMSKKILELDRFGGLTLRGEIRNLFDKDYEYVKDYPMPGRSFFLGLRYDI
ncbi:MAG: TonB-dependent receptor [Deltaproteobacteria bacterium]